MTTYPHESYFDHVLSPDQIFNRTFDRSEDALRVAIASGSVNLSIGTVSLGSVKVEDATDSSHKMKVWADGSIDANIVISGSSDNIALTDATGSVINPATEASVQAVESTLINIRDAYSTGGNPSAVDVLTTATLLLSAASSRKKIMLYNFSNSTTCFIGGSGVTMFTGIPILPQSVYTDGMPYCGQEAIYGIVQNGSCSIRVKEWN